MPQPLRLRRVAYSYDSGRVPLEALAEVSLEVPAAEFVALVGPSGCGKTTLLRLVAGLAQPTSGEIDMPDSSDKVGFVFQQGALLPWRTVRQNVLLPLELQHWPEDRAAVRVEAMIAAVGLAGFGDALPRELSGGMRQRVALARALADDPPLLLLDEPFASLDALSRERMNEELQRIWLATRKTVLLVTHSIEEAVFLSDRVVVLSHRPGRIRDVVCVPFARPRLTEVRYSAEFAAIAARVRAVIEEAELQNGDPLRQC
ncbi:MAG: ABC transporter ATP-binding protein [Anaerolineae bacterium]